MKSPKEFGIEEGYLVQIDLEGEKQPHLYLQEYVVIENNALVVGDEIGMKVASYPYDSYYQLENGNWFFESEVGDYELKNGPLESSFDDMFDDELDD